MKRLILLASLMLIVAGCTVSAEKEYVRKAAKLSKFEQLWRNFQINEVSLLKT